MHKFFSLFLLLSLVANTHCKEGVLDTTFGNGGKVITDIIPANTDEAHSVLIQPDCKIVAGGTTQTPAFTANFALVRYNTNGSLDTTFGTNGKVVTPNFKVGSSDIIRNMVLDNNGNIIAAGITGNQNTGVSGQVLVAKYKSNGTLDNSFGQNGRVLISQLLSNFLRQTEPDPSPDLVLQPDNKIVVASFALVNNLPHFALARLNANGTLDKTFGNNGIVITPSFANQSTDLANRISIQSDGKLLVGGNTTTNNLPTFAVARYNTNGTLDKTFGNNGQVVVPFDNAFLEALGIDNKGNIILLGTSQFQILTVKVLPNGTLDKTFGQNGFVLTSQGSIPTSLIVQQNNKIVVSGFTDIGVPNFIVIRYNENGTLDKTFGNNGTTTTSFGVGTASQAFDLAIECDGKIVLAGRELVPGRPSNFALARYNADVACINGDLFLNSLLAKYQ